MAGLRITLKINLKMNTAMSASGDEPRCRHSGVVGRIAQWSLTRLREKVSGECQAKRRSTACHEMRARIGTTPD